MRAQGLGLGVSLMQELQAANLMSARLQGGGDVKAAAQAAANATATAIATAVANATASVTGTGEQFFHTSDALAPLRPGHQLTGQALWLVLFSSESFSISVS